MFVFTHTETVVLCLVCVLRELPYAFLNVETTYTRSTEEFSAPVCLVHLVITRIFLHCRWRVEEMDDCSTSCSRGFIRRKVTCIKQSVSGVTALPDTECEKPKPSSIGRCHGRCSPTVWRYSDWSNVSFNSSSCCYS